MLVRLRTWTRLCLLVPLVLVPINSSAQQSHADLPATSTIRSPAAHLQAVMAAIVSARGYLEQSCGPTGRFAYLVDTESGELSPSYNIVRHAGAIYSLALLNKVYPDPNVVNTMVRAANFLRANYLTPPDSNNSSAVAVWSRPPPENRKAELGAAGLALVALSSVEKARPNAIPLTELEAMARFVLFLQKPDGSFYSRYFADRGLDRNWQSLTCRCPIRTVRLLAFRQAK
jgi:hypothetical protein